jgi:hypothetical protein
MGFVKIGFVSQNFAAGSHRFCFGGFRRRTPGPPPFSSMNSTPAHYHLFGASGSLRQPQTHTAAVLRYEPNTSFFKRLDNSFDSPALRT